MLVELQHTEILLHGLTQLSFLRLDVLSVERARLVMDVGDAYASVRVPLVAHLQCLLILFVGVC